MGCLDWPCAVASAPKNPVRILLACLLFGLSVQSGWTQSTGLSVDTNPSTTGNYTVSWSQWRASTESYELYESTDAGESWTWVYTGGQRTRAFTGKANGLYRYRVEGCEPIIGCVRADWPVLSVVVTTDATEAGDPSGMLSYVSDPAYLAGDFSGAFSVSADGTARYVIPIVAPPGTAGMEPALSLRYDSSQGTGLLGVGWFIDGLSEISRCGATEAQDDSTGTVSFTGTDRFCLDGEKLLLVDGANGYGGNGSVYRTEVDPIRKVISHDTAGAGPGYFKVWDKDGRVYEYGNSVNSRIEGEGQGTTALVWALSRITDSHGNYIQFDYEEDSDRQDYRIKTISYTGNAGVSPVLDTYASAARAPRATSTPARR